MYTGLSLEEFREELGYHPWHFWGLADNGKLVPKSACNTVIRKYTWQMSDALGREEILSAIKNAHDKIFRYMKVSLFPRYVESIVQYPRPNDTRLHHIGYMDHTTRTMAVNLPEGQVWELGVENITQVGEAPVVYTDQDGDGIQDTFTATIASGTITNHLEVAVYFKDSDRLDFEAVGDKWRILPVSISIFGGNIVVRGRRWLLVKPVKYEGVVDQNQFLDQADPANFVDSVLVCRRRTNTEGITTSDSQAVLIWENSPIIGDADRVAGSDPYQIKEVVARAALRNEVLGLVGPAEATYDAATQTWSIGCWQGNRQPDKVKIRYLGGYPLANGKMNPEYRKVVAHLAAAELPRRISACDVANKAFWYWQMDLARAGGFQFEQYRISKADLDNPLGTRMGQVMAWKFIIGDPLIDPVLM